MTYELSLAQRNLLTRLNDCNKEVDPADRGIILNLINDLIKAVNTEPTVVKPMAVVEIGKVYEAGPIQEETLLASDCLGCNGGTCSACWWGGNCNS